MLTPNDGSTDGKFTAYLEHPEKWSSYDPALFQTLRDLLNKTQQRNVSLIERSKLLVNTNYFNQIVPDSDLGRCRWFDSLKNDAKVCDLIFLDPDNGIEVKSKPYGYKNSSKYVYWKEIEELWSSGKSLLIYQHFIRENRYKFVTRMLSTLNKTTPSSIVEAFSTPHVVFLMALQPTHQLYYSAIIKNVKHRWGEQIQHWELTRAQDSV